MNRINKKYFVWGEVGAGVDTASGSKQVNLASSCHSTKCSFESILKYLSYSCLIFVCKKIFEQCDCTNEKKNTPQQENILCHHLSFASSLSLATAASFSCASWSLSSSVIFT